MKNTMKNTFIFLATTMVATSAFAQDAAANNSSQAGMIALGAGLAIGLAAIGGAIAQAMTAASALDGIARNPAAQSKIFTPMIIGLALIESLVIYAFVIAFFLQGKF
jgi:F-type H+-transporting ATPase subunit c